MTQTQTDQFLPPTPDLTTVQLQEAARQSVAEPKKRNVWPFIAGVAVTAAVGLAVVVATGGGDADGTESRSRGIIPTADKPSADATSVDSAGFFLAFTSADLIDVMDTAVTDVGRSTDAINDGDYGDAADYSRDAADTYREIADEARDLPGADSEAGVLTITTMETCADALDIGADLLDARDFDGMGSMTELEDCSEGLKDVQYLAEDLGAVFGT